MMKARTATYLALLGLLLLGRSSQGFGAESNFAGAAALLEIGVGARPLGMGGAFTALADDENAVFYNPAGLAFLTKRGLTSLYSRQFELLDYSVIGLAGRSIGFQLLQLSAAGIERTNEFGNPDGTSFSYLSRAGLASFGLALGERGLGLGVGARLKLYQEISDGESGFGWALDPAIIVVRGCLRLGAVLENGLQGAIRFGDGHLERWATDLQLGGALSLPLWERAVMNLLFDLGGLFTGRSRGQLGVELWIEGLGLRAGLDGAGAGLTLGSSVWVKALRLDWAYALHPFLPDSSRLSLTLRF